MLIAALLRAIRFAANVDIRRLGRDEAYRLAVVRHLRGPRPF